MRRATDSYWWDDLTRSTFPTLDGDLTTDVVVVGAGITGLTAAALLAQGGRRVVVIDKDQVGAGETGLTTSHATQILDVRYHALIRDFGREAARLVAASKRDAIEIIASLALQHGVECEFSRVPGYLYTEREGDVGAIEEECAAAQAAGVDARVVRAVPLPFPAVAAMEIPNQAQFHALQFVLGLARQLEVAGVRIFGRTPALSTEEGEPCRVETPHGTITANALVVAAHVPVNNRFLLHTQLIPTRSYVVATPVPAGTLAPGLFWDTDDPYHYNRVHPGAAGPVLIVGGADHHTGDGPQGDAPFQSLQHYAQPRFGVRSFRWRWSGQIVTSIDGLPFIGPNPGSSNAYVATAFAGNGTTFGALAGRIVADLVLGRPNPYAEVYSPLRLPSLASAPEFLKQNARYPLTVVLDRLTNLDAENATTGSVKGGEGRILNIEGRKYAVARDMHGRLHVLSPVCPHMKCDVAWNPVESSWDCPCHGSRFDIDGQVLNGPATTSLEPASPPFTREGV